jgi:hypothetical protein
MKPGKPVLKKAPGMVSVDAEQPGRKHSFEQRSRPECCASSLSSEHHDWSPEAGSVQKAWPRFKIDAVAFDLELGNQTEEGRALAVRLKEMTRSIFRRSADDTDLELLTPSLQRIVNAGHNVRRIARGGSRPHGRAGVLLNVHWHCPTLSHSTQRAKVAVCMILFESVMPREFRLSCGKTEPAEQLHHTNACRILSDAVHAYVLEQFLGARATHVSTVWNEVMGADPSLLLHWFGSARALVPRQEIVVGGVTTVWHDLVPLPTGRVIIDRELYLQNSLGVSSWYKKEMGRQKAKPHRDGQRSRTNFKLSDAVKSLAAECAHFGHGEANPWVLDEEDAAAGADGDEVSTADCTLRTGLSRAANSMLLGLHVLKLFASLVRDVCDQPPYEALGLQQLALPSGAVSARTGGGGEIPCNHTPDASPDAGQASSPNLTDEGWGCDKYLEQDT